MNRPPGERPPDAAHVGHLPLRDRVVPVAQLRLERARFEVDRLTSEIERHQPAVDGGGRLLDRLPGLQSKQIRGPALSRRRLPRDVARAALPRRQRKEEPVEYLEAVARLEDRRVARLFGRFDSLVRHRRICRAVRLGALTPDHLQAGEPLVPGCPRGQCLHVRLQVAVHHLVDEDLANRGMHRVQLRHRRTGAVAQQTGRLPERARSEEREQRVKRARGALVQGGDARPHPIRQLARPLREVADGQPLPAAREDHGVVGLVELDGRRDRPAATETPPPRRAARPGCSRRGESRQGPRRRGPATAAALGR